MQTPSSDNRILVYTSTRPVDYGVKHRVEIVCSAVSKLAANLKLKMEVVEKDELLSTYVFYRCESGVEIPMYRDWGKNWSEEEVYRTIRNMMFVLSFLPDHPVLSTLRDKITLFS